MIGLWIEDYRPKKFEDIKGQDKIVERFKAMVRDKNLLNCLLAGPAGCGKTSIILATAKELYGENWRDCVMETNASSERGIQVVRESIKSFARTKAISNAPFKICILDEADALTKEAQQALRRTMEQYSGNTRFCLIANYSSKIIDPIQSRCAVFRFKPLKKEHIEEVINDISKKEGLKIGRGVVDSLYEVSGGDVRKAINVLQSSANMSKNISEELIYEIVSSAKPKEIVGVLKLSVAGEFVRARDLLLDTMLKHGLSGLDLIKQIQREILNLDVDGKKKVEMIEKCGEIEFRMVEGSDEFVQMEALLASFCK